MFRPYPSQQQKMELAAATGLAYEQVCGGELPFEREAHLSRVTELDTPNRDNADAVLLAHDVEGPDHSRVAHIYGPAIG